MLDKSFPKSFSNEGIFDCFFITKTSHSKFILISRYICVLYGCRFRDIWEGVKKRGGREIGPKKNKQTDKQKQKSPIAHD